MDVLQPGNRHRDTLRHGVLVCTLMYIPHATTRMSSSRTETSGTEHETLSRRPRICNVLNKTRRFTTTVWLSVSLSPGCCFPRPADRPGPGSVAVWSGQLCRVGTSPSAGRLSGSPHPSDSWLFPHFPKRVGSSHTRGVRGTVRAAPAGSLLQRGVMTCTQLPVGHVRMTRMGVGDTGKNVDANNRP